MTKQRVIGSTDVYSRRHIDRNFDRLERLYQHEKERRKALEDRVVKLERTVFGALPDYR